MIENTNNSNFFSLSNNQNDNNNNIINSIENNYNIHLESIKINYFTLFGKKRRLPLYDYKGPFITISLLLIGTIFYEKNLYSIYSIDLEKKNLYKRLMIISIIILIITLIFYFELFTSIPGYQKGKKISLTEFLELKPAKIINNKIFNLKYCQTCSIIKELRTFHCKICGICIERHDHHCSFASNCIGKNNYKLFFYFLIISLIHLLPICFFEGYFFYRISYLKKNINKENDIKDFNFISFFFIGIVVLILVCFFIFFLITSIISHIYLISINKTTNESIRKIDISENFNKGCYNNWKEIFCEN